MGNVGRLNRGGVDRAMSSKPRTPLTSATASFIKSLPLQHDMQATCQRVSFRFGCCICNSPSLNEHGIIYLPDDSLTPRSAHSPLSFALQQQADVQRLEEWFNADSALGAPPRHKLGELGLSLSSCAFRPDLLSHQRAQPTVNGCRRNEDMKGQEPQSGVVRVCLRSERILYACVGGSV